MKTRQTRAGTAGSIIETFKTQQKILQPPSHTNLNKDAKIFFEDIVSARDASMWNDVDLSRAVMLANYMLEEKKNYELLNEEGAVVVNERGTQIQNPRFTVLKSLTDMINSLSRVLQTNAMSTQGRTRKVTNKNKEAKSAKEALSKTDFLIPGA